MVREAPVLSLIVFITAVGFGVVVIVFSCKGCVGVLNGAVAIGVEAIFVVRPCGLSVGLDDCWSAKIRLIIMTTKLQMYDMARKL